MRSTPASTPRGHYIWAAGTFLLTCVFLAMTVPDLGKYPTVSGDDSWVMSASYKLAMTGVFGSDLYTGFHGAEQHYYIALPVYHLLQALNFELFGASVASARAVTVTSAVVVLWATTWLALRWYGLATSLVSGAMLVLLRVNLVGLWPGLPLVAVGRTGRYDMTGVACIWLTIVLLDRVVEQPGRRPIAAFACGVAAGLATLTQFFGVFTIPVIAVVLLWTTTDRTTMLRSFSRIAAGWVAIVAPYALYVAMHWSAFRGQSTLKAGRTDFLDLGFYLDNLRDEPDRYAALIDSGHTLGNGVANWMFVLLAAPIVGWLVVRSRRPDLTGDRILLTTLAAGAGGLALFDSTNVPLYTISLWPACCIALAAGIVFGAGWVASRLPAMQPGRATFIGLSVTVAIVLTTLISADSIDAYRDDRQRRQEVTDYMDVADEIDAMIPEGGVVFGHERWWWGLHKRDFRALNVLRFEWEHHEDDAEPPSFAALFDATGAGAIVIDDNIRSELGRYPTPLREQIEAFLANDATLEKTITDPTYGRFEVYLRR